MAKITIDNKEYDTELFSENAKLQFNSLQFVQAEINRLQVKCIFEEQESIF